MWWTIIHIIIRPGSSITIIFLTVQLKNQEEPIIINIYPVMTVTFFLMIFPWRTCMDNQFKKGNSILFLNNLSSVIYFCIFWGFAINLCAK